MVDFKKALSRERYAYMKDKQPDVYKEIVAFSSTFGGEKAMDISIRAEVEDYCMGLARRMYQEGLRTGSI